MANRKTLQSLGGIALKKVRNSGLQLQDVDLVEFAAILTWRLHVDGNTEGQANVRSTSWSKVSASWQGKYRKCVKAAIAAT